MAGYPGQDLMWMVAKRGARLDDSYVSLNDTGSYLQELSCHTSATAFSLRLAFLQLI
jgi:hypothetical protein